MIDPNTSLCLDTDWRNDVETSGDGTAPDCEEILILGGHLPTDTEDNQTWTAYTCNQILPEEGIAALDSTCGDASLPQPDSLTRRK